MAKTIEAKANPEKRLFISLLTRDIPLIAAFLDLLDNAINAAVEPHAARLETAKGYMAVFQDETVIPSVSISLHIGPEKVEIKDTAGGISAETAANHVFRFGRGEDESQE